MTAAARDVPTRSRPLVDADAADEDSARAARASASSRARRDIARRISRGRRANGVNNDATTLAKLSRHEKGARARPVHFHLATTIEVDAMHRSVERERDQMLKPSVG
jgi:hypothetical protein